MSGGAETFEQLFRRAPVGLLTTDAAGIVTRVNDTLLDWIGKAADVVVDAPFTDLLETGSRMFYETRHQPVLRLQGSVTEVALTLVCADGSTLPVLCNSTAVFDEQGGLTSVRTAIVDTSQRLEYERAMLDGRRTAEQSERRLRVLQRSATAFVACTDAHELGEQLRIHATEAFDARVAVFAVDADGGLERIAGTGRPPGRPGTVDVSRVLHRPEAEALRIGRPVLVSTPDEAEAAFPELAPALREARVAALAAIPLLHEGVVIGVMVCVYNRPRRFDDDTIELKEALALQAAQVLVRLQLQAELQRLALHDGLTGLANRTFLRQRLDEALGRALRSHRPLATVFFDLDGFKRVNDELGHQVGDEVLRTVSARLLDVVRSVDVVSRYGGDEFVVLCEETDPASAAAVAERIRVAVGAPIAGVSIAVTASIGVILFDPTEASLATVSTELLLGRADDAMYRSKNSGRDRVTVDIVR